MTAANTPPKCTAGIVSEANRGEPRKDPTGLGRVDSDSLNIGFRSYHLHGHFAPILNPLPAKLSQLERPAASYTAPMRIIRHHFELATEGHGHVIDLSDEISTWLGSIAAGDGQLVVFTPGSTAAVTTIEFEPGAVQDLDDALERIAPSDRDYHHDRRWGDGNGFSHLRAALLGPSLAVPVAAGACITGTWQQIVLVECDLRPRRRRVVFSYIGDVGDLA